MSIIRSLFMAAVVGGGLSYLYDANAAPRVVIKTKVIELDTDHRCRRNHESMCKYYAVVATNTKPRMEYKFRIPLAYYHQKLYKVKETTVPVMLKQKKIWGARIIGLEPREQKKIDDLLAQETANN